MLNDLSTNFSAVTFLWDIFVIMACLLACIWLTETFTKFMSSFHDYVSFSFIIEIFGPHIDHGGCMHAGAALAPKMLAPEKSPGINFCRQFQKV
jgi:hypothetical protein